MPYTINKDNVIRAAATGQQRTVVWGEAVDAGQSVYLDTASQKWMLCDSSVADKPASTDQLAFAISSGLLDQTGTVAQGLSNVINVGAHGGQAGEVIVNLGAGVIGEASELPIGSILVIVGWTTSTTQIELFPNVTGVVAT